MQTVALQKIISSTFSNPGTLLLILKFCILFYPYFDYHPDEKSSALLKTKHTLHKGSLVSLGFVQAGEGREWSEDLLQQDQHNLFSTFPI